MTFDLAPPTKVTFIISVVLAVIAIVIQYLHITVAGTHGEFVIRLVGYLVLLAVTCLGQGPRGDRLTFAVQVRGH